MELSGQGWDAGVLSMWLACGAWELGEMRTRERRAQALGLSAFGGLGEEAWPLTTCGLGKAGGGSGSGQREWEWSAASGDGRTASVCGCG